MVPQAHDHHLYTRIVQQLITAAVNLSPGGAYALYKLQTTLAPVQ